MDFGLGLVVYIQNYSVQAPRFIRGEEEKIKWRVQSTEHLRLPHVGINLYAGLLRWINLLPLMQSRAFTTIYLVTNTEQN